MVTVQQGLGDRRVALAWLMTGCLNAADLKDRLMWTDRSKLWPREGEGE